MAADYPDLLRRGRASNCSFFSKNNASGGDPEVSPAWMAAKSTPAAAGGRADRRRWRGGLRRSPSRTGLVAGRPRARVDQHAMRPGLICLPRRERAQLDLRREIFFRAKSAPMTPYRWTFGQSFSGVYDSANDPLGDRIREDKISASEERTVRQEAWSTPPPSANWCAIWQEPPIP